MGKLRDVCKKIFLSISPVYRKVSAISAQIKELRDELYNQHPVPAAPAHLLTPDPKNTEFWHAYYHIAEEHAPSAFKTYIKPFIDKYPSLSLDSVLDFACGFGRIAGVVKDYADNITLCDINALAIDYCKKRFSGAGAACRFDYCVPDKPLALPLQNNRYSFIYSWDSMVHFSYKWLDYYLREFFRITKAGGYVLLHHSNYGNVNPESDKSENWFDNPHGRTNVTMEDVSRLAERNGFTVMEQNVLDWADVKNLDCLTLLYRN